MAPTKVNLLAMATATSLAVALVVRRIVRGDDGAREADVDDEAQPFAGGRIRAARAADVAAVVELTKAMALETEGAALPDEAVRRGVGRAIRATCAPRPRRDGGGDDEAAPLSLRPRYWVWQSSSTDEARVVCPLPLLPHPRAVA